MIADSCKWFALAGLIITSWLVYLLSPILTPFLFSGLFRQECLYRRVSG